MLSENPARSGDEPAGSEGDQQPSGPPVDPIPLDELQRIVDNARWLQQEGLLRYTKGPPLLRIHPAARSPATQMRLPRPSIAWTCLLLAVLALVAAAYLFRYERFPVEGSVAVWDRWTHRVCVLQAGGWRCLPRPQAVGTTK